METYVIRRAFVIPLGIVLLLCLILAGIVVVQQQPAAKLLVLGCAILPLGFLLFECSLRRIEIDAAGIRMIRLGRVRAFTWGEITSLETVRVRQRAFLTVCAGEEFLIVSNMYAGFGRLLAAVLERVPAAVVSAETQALATAPPVKHSDVVILWALAALMAYLIAAQFPG